MGMRPTLVFGTTPWKAECIAATIVCRNRDVRQTSFCKTHRPGIDAEFPQAIAVHGHATPVARPITLPGTRVFSGSPKFHEGNDRSVEADQVLMRLLTRLHPHRLFPPLGRGRTFEASPLHSCGPSLLKFLFIVEFDCTFKESVSSALFFTPRKDFSTTEV